MEELLKAIANWGFPIVVSVYLLVKIEAKLDALEQAIKDLSLTIARINGSLGGKG
ncbi:TPA: YvrJ family protein [bacterium]|jgi:hypothetical protein|nr:YvrJ family protein [bacterium]HPC78592.1 YvrJ family protein [bacterium]